MQKFPNDLTCRLLDYVLSLKKHEASDVVNRSSGSALLSCSSNWPITNQSLRSHQTVTGRTRTSRELELNSTWLLPFQFRHNDTTCTHKKAYTYKYCVLLCTVHAHRPRPRGPWSGSVCRRPCWRSGRWGAMSGWRNARASGAAGGHIHLYPERSWRRTHDGIHHMVCLGTLYIPTHHKLTAITLGLVFLKPDYLHCCERTWRCGTSGGRARAG